MRHFRTFATIGALALAATTGIVASQTGTSGATTCARYLAETGDGVPYGTDDNNGGNRDTSTPSITYGDDLLTTLNTTPSGSGPWCLKNFAQDPGTTDNYVTGGSTPQQTQVANLKPTLITLTLGRQNGGLVDSITTCLTDIKNHEFTEANACALGVLANTKAFSKLTTDLSAILNKDSTLMSTYPKLVVAITGYYNPYAHATTVATKIPSFCSNLTDTIPTCIARWILLPPALITLDEVVKQINSTISAVVAKYALGFQNRFVFVNPYDQFNDHCMTMNVTIKTTVYHPTSTVEDHNADKTQFGCDSTYIGTDGNNGGTTPFIYLSPAFDGVLLVATQTTEDMGINPNKDGHACIAKLIWFNVYQKLGYPASPIPPSTCS